MECFANAFSFSQHEHSQVLCNFHLHSLCPAFCSAWLYCVIIEKVSRTSTAAIYQISVATLCLQGIHSLSVQQLLQTIDKICMNAQASVVPRSKGTQSLRFLLFSFFKVLCCKTDAFMTYFNENFSL